MSRVENVLQRFSNGFNCSQAVFSTYCDQLGLDQETALKVSCPFGGGIGRMGETCGAVTGAFLLIGLKYGKYLQEDTVGKEKTYATMKEFTEKFSEIHGSIRCKDLLKYDMNNPEDLKVIKEKGLWDSLCPIYVESASRIIEEMLGLE